MADDSTPGTTEDGPNPEHLAILRQGVFVWNKWYAENPDIRPNLRHADLSGLDLHGANLRLAYLRKAKFKGSDLNGVDLQWANLTRADLSESLHLRQNQIDLAFGNWLTLLPHGLTYPDRWEKEPAPNSGIKSGDDVRDFSEWAFKPFPDPEDQPGPKSPLPDILSPFPMAWNAEGKIAVVPPQERPPAHGLSSATRDLLAQALTVMATDLANHIRSGNSDQNIANRLDSYARECAKGGAELNILRLDAIVRTLSGLVRKEKDALSAIDSEEYSVFAGDHDRLTGFYPDFEDYRRALSGAPEISAPPDVDLAKLMREPPGPEVFDASVPDAIDDILPQSGVPGTPVSRGDKSWRYAFLGVIIALKKLFDDAPQNLIKVVAVQQIYHQLTPVFESLITFLGL